MAATKSVVSLFFGVLAIIVGNMYIQTLPVHIRTTVFKIQFLTIFQGIVSYGSYIIWQTVRQALKGSKNNARKIIKFSLAIFLVISNTSYLSAIFLKDTHPHWYAVFSFICFGFFAQLIFAVLTLKGLCLLAKGLKKIGLFTQRPEKTRHPDDCTPQNCTFKIGRVWILLIFIYSVAIGLYGVHNAFLPPSVARVNITLPRLPPSLSGVKILQLADIHLGETVGRQKMKEIVEIAQKLQPDMVVLVGDLVDGRVDQLKFAAEPLKELKPPRGKYFVTGNHEYISMDVDNWFRYLETLGFTILHNSNIRITDRRKNDRNDVRVNDENTGDEYFCLAGVDDWTAERSNWILDIGHGMDVDKALEGCDDKHATVLLAHQPHAAKHALDTNHSIQLVLSGHTHGGQFFPASVLIYLTNPFYSGLYEYKDSLVYVSQGAVYWGIPMRIGSRSQMDLITLYALEYN